MQTEEEMQAEYIKRLARQLAHLPRLLRRGTPEAPLQEYGF
jgi:hypothetical protein